MNRTLIQYMTHIKNLESLIYTQNLLINSLSEKANRLAISRKINETRRVAPFWLSSHLHFVAFICLVALAGTSWLSYDSIWNGLEDKYIAPSGGYYFAMSAWDRKTEAFAKSVLLGIAVAVVVFILVCVWSTIRAKQIQKDYDMEYKRRVDARAKDEEARIAQESRVKVALLEQIELLKKQKEKTRSVLDQLYAMNILAEKYRDLIPVATMCEYLELGRCSSLRGHEGAYNIYEMERRLNRIITQQEEIIRRLDEIRDNQFALYSIVTQANDRLARIERSNNRMMDTMGSIKSNTDLIAFNTEATAVAARATGEFLVMKELLRNW